MSDREQAIKDVAKATKSSAAIIAQILEDGVSLRVKFAISQRERVIALERALREIEEILNPDKEDGYRADDPEGAMDTAHSKARAALNGESK